MISFLKRLFGFGRSAPQSLVSVLKGAPVRPRIKTYSAETGSVYQYVFRGYRAALDSAGREYIFEVRAASTAGDAVIRLLDKSLTAASESIARPILDTELYAIAKMALFDSFDTRECPVPGLVTPGPEEMLKFLRELGRL